MHSTQCAPTGCVRVRAASTSLAGRCQRSGRMPLADSTGYPYPATSQVSFSDLAMAEYAAARVAASKPPPLPERLVKRNPRAVRSWRMVVLRYNAWRRASTVAKRQ